MKLTHSLAELQQEHVVLELECIDRMYLNAYVPQLTTEGGIAAFCRGYLGHRFASTKQAVAMTETFIKSIRAFLENEGLELVRFQKGQRKDEVLQKKLRHFNKAEGVVFVGVAQEKVRVPRTTRKATPNGGTIPWIMERWQTTDPQFVAPRMDACVGQHECASQWTAPGHGLPEPDAGVAPGRPQAVCKDRRAGAADDDKGGLGWTNGDKANYYWSLGSEFKNPDIVNRFPKGPPVARLEGDMTVDLYGVQKVAEAPLRPAEFEALPGLWFDIEKVSLAGDQISMELSERNVHLMFDRSVDTASEGDSGPATFSCILYHPGSGEAFLMSQDNSYSLFPAVWGGDAFRTINLRFPYSALRERLAGVSAADWMREARLCVFMPVYAGTSHFSFHDESYHWLDYGNNARGQKENLDDAKIIEATTLPASPTAQQLDAYLDTILLNIPDGPGKGLRHTVETKLSAIGVSGLPALLRRLPVRQDVELAFVFPVISKLITREQLPDLRAALEHDDDLVQIFEQKEWQADARDVLVAKLADHRQPMVPKALRIAAEAKDPATYTDLRWHFVHLDRGHEEVMDVLEKCPGFDVAGAVREAWEYARLGAADSGELSAVAARWGLPDALNVAVFHAGKARDWDTQKSHLSELAALTGYNGSTNAELTWLTANLGHFRYDKGRQRYSLEP